MFPSVSLHSQPVQRHFKAPRNSFAYVFHLFTVVVVIVVPLFLACPSDREGGSLWKKVDSYREQPDVQFSYKMIIEMQIIDEITGVERVLYHSTFDVANALRNINDIRMAEISISKYDINLDGKRDSFHIRADIPLNESENVVGIKCLAAFDYCLSGKSNVKVEALAHVFHQPGTSGSHFTSQGSMRFHQNSPLEIDRGYVEIDKEEKILESGQIHKIPKGTGIDYLFAQQFTGRHVRATFEEDVSTWRRTQRDSSGKSLNSKFHLSVKINIPFETVLYLPTYAEILRHAWMQYLAMLVVVIFIVRQMRDVVYGNYK